MTVTLQKGVTVCTTCPNLMHPHRAILADYPGTVLRVNSKTCMSCDSRKQSQIKRDLAAIKFANNDAGLSAFMTARRKRIAKLNRTVTT